MGVEKNWQRVIAIALVFLMCVLLMISGMQARRYARLEKEISVMQANEKKLIDENQKLVTEISKLQSSEYIEKIAVEELGMRKAGTEEIIRVEVKR